MNSILSQGTGIPRLEEPLAGPLSQLPRHFQSAHSNGLVTTRCFWLDLLSFILTAPITLMSGFLGTPLELCKFMPLYFPNLFTLLPAAREQYDIQSEDANSALSGKPLEISILIFNEIHMPYHFLIFTIKLGYWLKKLIFNSLSVSVPWRY